MNGLPLYFESVPSCGDTKPAAYRGLIDTERSGGAGQLFLLPSAHRTVGRDEGGRLPDHVAFAAIARLSL